MNAHAWNSNQNGVIEDRYELEPQSPSTSLSSWSIEKGGSLSGTRKSQSHKASQSRLLAWVAIARNCHPLISSAQRCTCPMVCCVAAQFPSPEAMHMHLKTSACLFKSTYRCLETGKEARIGKCDSVGCQELKGRFESAVSSSIESVKRHLSGRRSKSLQASQPWFEKDLNPEETYSMATSWEENVPRPELSSGDHMHPAEIGSDFNGTARSRHEMDAYSVPSELYSTETPHRKPTNSSQEDHYPPIYSSDEPAATSHQDSFRYSGPQATNFTNGIHSVSHEYQNEPSHLVVQHESEHASPSSPLGATYSHTGLVELSAGGIYWRAHHAHQANSTWPMSSPLNNNNLGELYAGNVNTGLSGSSSLTCHGQDPYPHEQVTAPAYNDYHYNDKMVVGDYRTTDNFHDLPGIIHHNLQYVPRMDSTGSDSSFAPSMFSNVSNTSTSQSSFGSFSSIPANFNNPSFFGGGDSMMFEEPEPMEPSPTPMSYEQGYSHVSPHARRFDTAGVSIDNYVKPESYLSDPTLNHYQVPAPLQFTKESAKPNEFFAPPQAPYHRDPSPTTPSPFHPPPSTISSPSELSASSSPQHLLPGKAYCRHCQITCDMSNRSRHERTCKQNPAYANMARISCPYPGCPSTFNRSDNLRQHQKRENHFGTSNVELKISLTSEAGSPFWDFVEALGQQNRYGMAQGQEDDF